jgi:hypothetical protein
MAKPKKKRTSQRQSNKIIINWVAVSALAAVAIVIISILVFMGFGSKQPVVVSPTPSDQEVKTKIKRELDDFGRYLEKREHDTYRYISLKGSELAYNGLGRGSRMSNMLDREEKNALESLNEQWLSLERNLQDIVFSSGLRDTTIRTVLFLQEESAIKDSLVLQTTLAKNRIHDYVNQTKSARGLK